MFVETIGISPRIAVFMTNTTSFPVLVSRVTELNLTLRNFKVM